METGLEELLRHIQGRVLLYPHRDPTEPAQKTLEPEAMVVAAAAAAAAAAQKLPKPENTWSSCCCSSAAGSNMGYNTQQSVHPPHSTNNLISIDLKQKN